MTRLRELDTSSRNQLAKMRAAAEEVQNKDHEFAELQRRNEDLEETVRSLRAVARRTTAAEDFDRANELERRLKDVTQQLEEMTEQVADTKQQLAEVNQQLEDKVAEAKDTAAELQAKESLCESLQSQCGSLEDQLEAKSAQCSTLQDQVERAEKENQELSDQNRVLAQSKEAGATAADSGRQHLSPQDTGEFHAGSAPSPADVAAGSDTSPRVDSQASLRRRSTGGVSHSTAETGLAEPRRNSTGTFKTDASREGSAAEAGAGGEQQRGIAAGQPGQPGQGSPPDRSLVSKSATAATLDTMETEETGLDTGGSSTAVADSGQTLAGGLAALRGQQAAGIPEEAEEAEPEVERPALTEAEKKVVGKWNPSGTFEIAKHPDGQLRFVGIDDDLDEIKGGLVQEDEWFVSTLMDKDDDPIGCIRISYARWGVVTFQLKGTDDDDEWGDDVSAFMDNAFRARRPSTDDLRKLGTWKPPPD